MVHIPFNSIQHDMIYYEMWGKGDKIHDDLGWKVRSVLIFKLTFGKGRKQTHSKMVD